MKLLLVCEGEGDDDDVITLTLRVLHEALPWMIGLESLAQPTPAWFEYEPGRRFLKWSDVGKVCDQHRVPRVNELGLRLGCRAAKRLTRLLSEPKVHPPDEPIRVLLVHDDDGVAGWRESFEVARKEWLTWLDEEARLNRRPRTDADIAIGVAAPEHEAWVLAGFVARDEAERQALESARKRLGFDPCIYGERLTSKRESDPKDAKRVLREVCADPERRRALLAEADLELLRARGIAIGLTAFLEELKARVASGYGAK